MSQNQNARREDCVGVALHYSAGNFGGTVAWCRDPKSRVSYHTVIGMNPGERTVLVPLHRRAWHMGPCRSSDPARLPYTDANSAFVGIAAATGNPAQPVSAWQFRAIVEEVKRVFAALGWPATETWRIVGHDTEAWPRGRKPDPTGPDATRPVLSVEAVRQAVAA